MAEKDGNAGPQDIEDGEDDAEPVEKTRIVLPGPHANESSSDDEDGRRPTKSLSLKRPRDVHEMLLNNNNGDESSRKEEANQTRTGRSKFPGAHRRKSGRWSAEIKDPFIKRRIWLGTFDKPEEASNAYAAKRLEFRERKESQSFMDRTLPEYESGRNGKQIDAGMNWEPVLTDNNGFLLGEFSNLDDDLTELNKFPKFPGVYRRKSGRWSAEIRDPFIKRQIRLGTFDTPEEASNAYTAKKLDFQERKGAKSYMDGTRPECDSGRNGEQIDAGRNWSGEQNDARRNWEPITIDSNLDDDLTKLNKFPGAYQRKSGRWWAEIRDPFIKRQIRLGTFDTPEEASNAYTAKKLEFRERKEAKSYMDGTRPQFDSGRNGEQIDAGRNWSGEQTDAGRNWEPILIDNNGFLLGDFCNLDDDLRIS